MFVCPNCGEPGISRMRKLVLSPGFPATCRKCGGLSVTGYAPWLATASPGSALFIAALWANTATLQWILNATAMVMMFVVPYWFLPMQKREAGARAKPDSKNPH